MPIGVLVTMTAKPGAAEELLGHLRSSTADTRTEPGSLMVVLMTDPSDDHRFHIFEIYRDEQAIEAHRGSAHATNAAPAIHALFGAPLEVRRFDTVNWPATLSVAYP